MPKAATTCFFIAISETLFESPWSPCQKRRPQVDFLVLSETFFWKSVKSVSKSHISIWEKWNILYCLWNATQVKFWTILLKSVKSMPKAATTGQFFLAFSATFLESPWSPCQNATYGLKKKCSLFPVKGHPGEIFRTSILSPWSPCPNWRPHVIFFYLSLKLLL